MTDVNAESNIREIDLHPVLVYPVSEGVLALDALMLVAGTATRGQRHHIQ